MPDFWPHDLIGWLTVLTSISGAVWVVIKFTFVKSFDQLNETHNQKYLFDGLHPNHTGPFIVASKVIGFINSNL